MPSEKVNNALNELRTNRNLGENLSRSLREIEKKAGVNLSENELKEFLQSLANNARKNILSEPWWQEP